MRIKVNLKIFVFIILFILTNQIKVYGILMLFAFLHELGHLIMGVCLGFRPVSISVKPMGISINFKVSTENCNKKVLYGNNLALKKMIIAFAGPFTNLIFVFLYVLTDINIFNIQKETAIYANILIGLFNLIPIYPLDGGRIIKNLLHILFNLENSYKYTYIISNVSIILLTILASFGILYFKNIAILLMILYLWAIIIIENKYYKEKMKIYKIIKQHETQKQVINN